MPRNNMTQDIRDDDSSRKNRDAIDAIRRGAIIGRYQMFHKGHLDIIRYIDAQPDIDEIVIGIGSSQYDRNNKNWEMPWITNPFSYEERREMVNDAIHGKVSKPVHILPVQDQHNCVRWVNYVIHTLPKFDVFFSNTKTETDHFANKGYEIRGIPIGGSFHAQTIREMIALGEDWQEYVPIGTQRFMLRIGGAGILRELFQEHSEEIIEAHNFFPDYEWRTFDGLTEKDLKNIMQIPVASRKEYVDDYLLSPDRHDINIKVRGDVLKIKKTLGDEGNGIEKTATYPYRFPIKTGAIDKLLTEIGLPSMNAAKNNAGSANANAETTGYVTQKEFTEYLVEKQGFHPIEVPKIREVRFYNSCAIDTQKIIVRGHDDIGRESDTIALESRSKNKILISLEDLGLDRYRPQGYTRFLSDRLYEKPNEARR